MARSASRGRKGALSYATQLLSTSQPIRAPRSRQPMTWSDVDWAATEAAVGRIQDRIFRAAKIKRPRLEPDDEQSSCPVLRGLGSGNGGRLPDFVYGRRKKEVRS